jgi:glycosyltransferase involved in cell wall biosynthesis
MRLALLARCDRRGIANQTAEMYRHLRPAKTLCALYGPALTPYEERPETFPDARVAPFDGEAGRFPVDAIDWLLADVDVVLVVETPGDWRIYEWGHRRGVATVVHANPELFLHARHPEIPQPTMVVVPTTWRIDRIPGAVHMPMPVDLDRLPYRPRTEARRFLHVAGHPAAHDRAGTLIAIEAANMLGGADLTIRARRPLIGKAHRLAQRTPGLRVIVDDIPDYAGLYDDEDVLLHPRKYGGLSLPLQEAMTQGMAVLAANREPERSMLPPESLVKIHYRQPVHFQPGVVEIDVIAPDVLAAAMRGLMDDPGLVARLSDASRAYACSIAWPRLLPAWTDLLGEAVRRERRTIGVRV